ncbi:hypothetical protein GJT97_01195 [Enterobacteriaceae endosymbiont of Donacia proxima]|uniref:hypothetical protein n=1 Tax=Enterobacteriaceae endosymbiont of Donacia proxima TaxID=2675782 RepID=UPI00144969F2|nr:hypothetical protein [Enterobacteriaceae endosymbiont of Donacia proxima]QJC35316.1 hypothetical protein GJT97_01195 [Enterobacteriaceae endosymbiont of Donacia proxima]
MNINKISSFSYIQFITPRLIIMIIVNNLYSYLASSLFNTKFNHSIKELLIALIPTKIIILGHISGGILKSIIICIF